MVSEESLDSSLNPRPNSMLKQMTGKAPFYSKIVQWIEPAG